jgi:hypothetical protein
MASLLLCLSILRTAFASPVLSPLNYLGPRTTAALTADSAPVFNTQYRSTIEIVWSSLAIIFASTWICVHPNVAGYKIATLQVLWRRMKLFALAVFAPELLAVFAFFQWKGCHHLHKEFREKAKELNICTLAVEMCRFSTLKGVRSSPRSRL